MSYIQRGLQPGETVVHEARLHPLIFLPALFLLLIALALLAASAQFADEKITIGLEAAAAMFGLLRFASWARATIRLPNRGDGMSVEALPSGPLEAEHRTLELGLRTWVERQTSQRLGYVEQLYTFGDRDRVMGEEGHALPALVVAYLALVREARTARSADASWQGWYRYFPWEDWRNGKPESLGRLEERLARWAAEAPAEPERRLREERLGLAFGMPAGSWNEELGLERYEVLYQAGRRGHAGPAPARAAPFRARAGK